MNYCLEVSGDFACFTRPEMKVERVSYDVMTPSAARAIFEAILWKPAICWQICCIEVLKPIRWVNLRRNEVSGVIAERNITVAMNAGKGDLAQYIEDERQQRAGLFLCDVRYRIHGRMSVLSNSGADNTPIKFREMFVRRASRGQCINQPYLGCREFAARFRWVPDIAAEPPDWSMLDDRSRTALGFGRARDLGYMLYDLDFANPGDPLPRFFRAQLENGKVVIPDAASEEIRG
jgi:CRISPR-associated protein Cas5d